MLYEGYSVKLHFRRIFIQKQRLGNSLIRSMHGQQLLEYKT